MVALANAPRSLPSDVVIVPQGSLTGLVIPRATFFRIRPTVRYLIDLAASSHFLSDSGDYCRIVETDRWPTLAALIDLAAEDWQPAMYDGWCLWGESPRPPVTLHAAEQLHGPHGDQGRERGVFDRLGA